MKDIKVRGITEKEYEIIKAIARDNKVSINSLLKGIIKKAVISKEAILESKKHDDYIKDILNVFMLQNDDINRKLEDLLERVENLQR